MMRWHGEERSLLSWLMMQEKFVALWIDETLSVAPPNGDFIARLETHRRWLAEQIDLLANRRAA